jgi:hypothetical protein
MDPSRRFSILHKTINTAQSVGVFSVARDDGHLACGVHHAYDPRVWDDISRPRHRRTDTEVISDIAMPTAVICRPRTYAHLRCPASGDMSDPGSKQQAAQVTA